jgi:hypothetical protein
MSGPISATMTSAGASIDPWNGVQQRHLLGEGSDHLLDPLAQQGNGLVQVLDVGQDPHRASRPWWSVRNRPANAPAQRRQLGPQPALGQRGQHRRVVGAGHQGFQHRPAGHTQNVSGHARQLDPGVLQDFDPAAPTSRLRSWIWVLR